ncbi:MAG: Lipoprotein signal peptidase [Parcubacteria group bacterium GW2011_GWA2_36_10]|nr:MAG: Lipoprotein signal peptidase [Parcubacteria group bacterium GW2011_GWA2_36_10]
MSKKFFVLLILFLLDRVLKIYFWQHTNFAYLNQNISFSLPIGQYFLWPILFLLIIFVYCQCLKNYQKNTKHFFAWGLIFIGAASNILDRLNYGGVIDFISVPYFTVFNLSDVFIFCGVVYLLLVKLKTPA